MTNEKIYNTLSLSCIYIYICNICCIDYASNMGIEKMSSTDISDNGSSSTLRALFQIQNYITYNTLFYNFWTMRYNFLMKLSHDLLCLMTGVVFSYKKISLISMSSTLNSCFLHLSSLPSSSDTSRISVMVSGTFSLCFSVTV